MSTERESRRQHNGWLILHVADIVQQISCKSAGSDGCLGCPTCQTMLARYLCRFSDNPLFFGNRGHAEICDARLESEQLSLANQSGLQEFVPLRNGTRNDLISQGAPGASETESVLKVIYGWRTDHKK